MAQRALFVVCVVSFTLLVLACGGQAPQPIANNDPPIKIKSTRRDEQPADNAPRDAPQPVNPAKPALPQTPDPTPQERIDALERELTKLNDRIAVLDRPEPKGRLQPDTLAVGQVGFFHAKQPFSVLLVIDARTLVAVPVIDDIQQFNLAFVLEGLSTKGMVDGHVFGLDGVPLEVVGTRRVGIATRFHVRTYENPAATVLASLRARRLAVMAEQQAIRDAEAKRFAESPEGKAQEAARLKRLQEEDEAKRLKAQRDAEAKAKWEAEAKALAKEQEAYKKLHLALQLVSNSRGKEETESGQRFLKFAVARLQDLVKQHPGTGAAVEAKQMLDEYREGKPLRRPPTKKKS